MNPPAAPPMTALLLATAGEGGAPKALLPLDGGTVVGRLVEQLRSLGAGRVEVLVRGPAPPARELPGGVEVVTAASLAEDLAQVAALARRGSSPLVVVDGRIVTHREALAGLLADPRSRTGVLVTNRALGGWPVRVEHDAVVSAGSAFHRVSAPTGAMLDVLRVDGRDRASLADAAVRLGAVPGVTVGGGDDLVALLTVALVRAGVPVGRSDLRELACARVGSAGDAERAAEALAAVDEDRVLLDSAVKGDDGLFTTYAVSSWSRYVARRAARLGMTPNQVTVVSMTLGVAAALCFAEASRVGLVAGAGLLYLAFVADCIDGQLARYTRTFSTLGAWLDATFDRGKEYVAYAGLAAGAARSGVGDVWGPAAAALTLQTVRHLVDFAYAAARTRTVAGLPQAPLDVAEDGLAPVVVAAGGAAALSARLDKRSATRWARKVVVLPIGERFALICLTAALFDARTTFTALLAWGGVAAAYTTAGRVLRSLASAAGPAGAGVRAYADHGPLAGLLTGPLAHQLGRLGRLSSSGRPGSSSRLGRLGWLAPPVIRAVEYTGLAAFGFAGGAPRPLVYALLGALAYHHYDVVYRDRQHIAAPSWVARAGLGWEGRLLLASAAAAAGMVTPVYAGLATWLWSLFAAESIASWTKADRARSVVAAEDLQASPAEGLPG